MIHPLELFIGLRYSRAKRRNQLVSFISVMSTVGIVLGVAAMITVLSVMNGFGKELRHRILGVVSHANIERVLGSLDNWNALEKKLAEHEQVVATAPYVNGQGMLMKGRQSKGVFIRGIDPTREQAVSQLQSKLVHGSLDALRPGQHGIIIGHSLAEALGLKPGSTVVLIYNNANSGRSTPGVYRLTVSGIFDVGMHQQDSSLALMHYREAMDLFGMAPGVTGLRVRLRDAYEARFFAYQMESELGEEYDIDHWMNRNSNFFIALEDQKRIMFLVLMLVVSVAAFNIVSTLIMLVTDKQSDIAILRTIGMSPGSIMLIFMFQGMLVALIGIAAGVGLGVLLALNSETIVHGIEQLFSINILSADIYPITDLPADIQLRDITSVIIVAAIASFVSTIYPAWRAARTQPAQALRYE